MSTTRTILLCLILSIIWIRTCHSFHPLPTLSKDQHIFTVRISSKGFAPSPGRTPKKEKNSNRSNKKEKHQHLSKEEFHIRNQEVTKRKSFFIPWWMREEENKNPDILPKYNPWWKSNNFRVDLTWPQKQLIPEAIRRGIDISCTKEELVERINQSFELYNLSDENFRVPKILESENVTAPCYPEVYERLVNE